MPSKKEKKILSDKKRLATLVVIAAIFLFSAVFMAGYAVGHSSAPGFRLPVSDAFETPEPETTELVLDDENPHFTADGKLRLNYATSEELQKLPGVGPATAAKIIEYRKSKGKFEAAAELMWVSGIGEATYAKIKPLVTVK